MGYKIIRKQLGQMVTAIGAIIWKWNKYKTTINHPQSGDCKIVQDNFTTLSQWTINFWKRTSFLGGGWVFQHHDDPKHVIKATKEWLEAH